MHTVSVDIKIPDGHEVEEVSVVWPGYDLSMGAAVGKMVVKTKAAKPLLINGVPSDWPEFLICQWVARDKNGKVFGYLGDEPRLGNESWLSECSYQRLSDFLAIYIPGPWEQSLRENPRRIK